MKCLCACAYVCERGGGVERGREEMDQWERGYSYVDSAGKD